VAQLSASLELRHVVEQQRSVCRNAYYDGVTAYPTLSDMWAAVYPRESASFSENPPFLSTGGKLGELPAHRRGIDDAPREPRGPTSPGSPTITTRISCDERWR